MSRSFRYLMVLLVITILSAPVTAAAPVDALERSTVSFGGDFWSQALDWFHSVAGSKGGPREEALDGSDDLPEEGDDDSEGGSGMDPAG